MDIEYWWLLALPLFFALGWMAARIDIKHLLSESRALPMSYFKGLNFLLNEQQDKAIEAFIEVVKVDPQTIELHFALGSLFRRRGEVERAIRMHQNLVERPDLVQEQKLQALFELAQDYLKAGLLDRAEELFLKLEGTAHAEAALKFLLEIYEQEKDWPKAIGIAEKLETVTGRSHQKEIANFCCELAGSEIMHSRPEAARPYLSEALAHHRLCVRANMVLGDLELAANRYAAAIEAWKRIESQNPAYLALVAERLLTAFKQWGRAEEGLNLLRGYLGKYPSLDLLNTVFQGTLEQHGAEPAYHLVRDELRRNPTLLGLDKLLEAQLLDAPIERRRDLELIKDLVHQHTRGLAMYKCDNCGFRARQFYWHCPACAAWETYAPRRTEEKGLPV
ncbi:MAG: lipopolysaccharide assembly protein LapB [Betaproteobacteria bacterium RIFCSPLOWO2_12_FULL_62_58]|nr:MAG: lipopolysaccharide assembly protein LapB [Betaproteobacteria bacterium RIFCSPLOWO2_02_FULL_62_79]OGA45819.1 MAG: lipopolysaccharide assembly protein LapB [Betaproteobacteria bacterium RIFCSPLOWO2_12_FULL_62_58]